MTRPPAIRRSSMVGLAAGSLSRRRCRRRCMVVIAMPLPSAPEPHPPTPAGQVEPGAEHGPRDRHRYQCDFDPAAVADRPEHEDRVGRVDQEAARHQQDAGHEPAAPTVRATGIAVAVVVMVRAPAFHRAGLTRSAAPRGSGERGALERPPAPWTPSPWVTEAAWEHAPARPTRRDSEESQTDTTELLGADAQRE